MKVTSKICMTKDIGVNGNLFGGNMLAWMDEAAAIYARFITQEPRVVTVKFGEIVFLKPVKCNDMVDFYCDSEVIGNTSISFDIRACVSGRRVFETSCVFVAVDEEGKKKLIDKSRI